MLTAEELREQLDYDPETGVFTRRVTRSSRVKIGDVAGWPDKDGYVRVRVLSRVRAAHRLAWLHVYGVWPPNEIDHINGMRGDNRIANLREATHAENSRNRKKLRNGRCALKGVYIKGARFCAKIKKHGKHTHVGCYDTEEEAHAAYVAAAEKEFGAFARAE
jgi:hypothetical protein